MEKDTRIQSIKPTIKMRLGGRSYRVMDAGGLVNAESEHSGAAIKRAREYVEIPSAFDPGSKRNETKQIDDLNRTTSPMRELGLANCAELSARHYSSVFAIDVDPTGNHCVSGSSDGDVRIIDIGAQSIVSKRGVSVLHSWKPFQGHAVHSLAYAQNLLLVAGLSCEAKLYDSEGRKQLGATPRGDMYLQDASKTSGHGAHTTKALWRDPASIDTFSAHFLTIGLDSTLRIWDSNRITNKANSGAQVRVIYLRKLAARGQRAVPQSVAVERSGGRLTTIGCDDGSLRVYDLNTRIDDPIQSAPRAIDLGAEFSSLACAADGHTILARSSDDSLRVWDTRNLISEIACFRDLPCTVSSGAVQLAYAEHLGDAWFATGTTCRRQRRAEEPTESSRLVLFNSKALKKASEIIFPESAGSSLSLSWAAQLQQMLVGFADGSLRLLNSDNHGNPSKFHSYSEQNPVTSSSHNNERHAPHQQLIRKKPMFGPSKPD